MLQTRNGRLAKIAARFAAVGAFAALNATSSSAQPSCSFINYTCEAPRYCGGSNYYRVDWYLCPGGVVVSDPNGCCYTTA